MSLWAIVPVKPLRRGKSRLSGVLSEEERTLLNYTMLASTLRTLKAVPEVDQVLVISRDMAALALARDFGARTVQEDGSSDLNTALKRATVIAQMYSASSVLILPADLPLIDPTGLQAFIQRAGKPPVIVIAPDRRNEGTNALLVSPVGLIDYQYGVDSYKKHTQQAEKYNLRIEIFEHPAFALDLDLPEDLDLLREIEMGELGRNGIE
jgi:2-phospho-L-lactate guanylyltransferase